MNSSSELLQTNRYKWSWWLLRLLPAFLPIIGWLWAFTQALGFLNDSLMQRTMNIIHVILNLAVAGHVSVQP